MNKLLSTLALVSALGFGVFGVNSLSYAEDAATPAEQAAEVLAPTVDAAPATVVPVAETAVAAPAVDAPVAEIAAIPAPTPNKGDTTFLLMATVLVVMMSIPGLALFYGGLVRSKNMLSILMQTFSIFALICVLWAIYGYSVAFTEGNAFFGGFGRAFLSGIYDPATGAVGNAASFSKATPIPEFAFVAFQATFAAITVALAIGGFAERMKFSAVMLFAVLWFTFSYLPIAHMVWYWAGPDAYTTADAATAASATAGWLWQKGALDFAGGTVVHINAGVAGLVGAIMVGKRIGFGKEAFTPHSLTMTMIGASLLWVGWFGFNAGSALEAGGTATLAFANTLFATAAATLTWLATEWLLKGKPSMLGAASGAVAGLVAITPACGWVGIGGGLAIGALAGIVCYWGVTGLKKMIGADDALDVFGIHAVGGILGAILTGVFNSWSLGGTGIYDYVANAWVDNPIGHQVWVQTQAVLTAVIWSGVVAFIVFKIVDILIGLRPSEDAEREGLDITEHGESAYHM